jgi:hypothetical protein
VPRRPSTISAGIEADRNTRKMIPGMISAMNPAATINPTSNEMRITLQSRRNPKR